MKLFQRDTKANNILSSALLLIGGAALVTLIVSYFSEWSDSFREWNMMTIYLVIGLSLLFNPWQITKYSSRYWLIRLCGIGTIMLTFYKPSDALYIFMIITVTLPYIIRSLEKGFLGKMRDKLIAKN